MTALSGSMSEAILAYSIALWAAAHKVIDGPTNESVKALVIKGGPIKDTPFQKALWLGVSRGNIRFSNPLIKGIR